MSVQKTVAMTDHHPIAWFSGLQRREKNTFWACVGGWVLDAMDVQMFSFAISAIIAVFAITNADAGLIGTATLLTFGVARDRPLDDRGRAAALKQQVDDDRRVAHVGLDGGPALPGSGTPHRPGRRRNDRAPPCIAVPACSKSSTS